MTDTIATETIANEAIMPKPSYLGLINAIATGEWQGYEYLTAWADVTTDPAVEAVLRTVAAREGEHAMTFAKRVNELGYQVRRKPVDEATKARAALAGSSATDTEKFLGLGYGEPRDPSAPDQFEQFFADHTIDPVTGALLGRFIAEERDSGRLLRECCAILAARGAC